MNPYQQFIAYSRYSRWLDKEQRRETWKEVTSRYLDYISKQLRENHNFIITPQEYKELFSSIENLQVLPSMRAMMMAGPALDRCNVGAYNCSYLPVDSVRAFDECMYILMCGTGVGFSVERQYVSQLPIVNEHFEDSTTIITPDDSRSGWAKSFRELLSLLYSGRIPSWDFSKLRPAGAKLKTTGGRSSGPEPLNALFIFCVTLFKKAAGRRLTSLECHDLMCKIGEVVVVGGVRRSALISLSNLSDERMRDAKAGQWWQENGQRALSNNSVCYTEKPDLAVFMREWLALYQSRSGERGIFNREAAKRQAEKIGRRNSDFAFGCNPCCVSGETLILTDKGYFPIQELVDVKTNIWNGDEWSEVEPYSVGITDTLKVHLSDGTVIKCTPNHKFCIVPGYNSKFIKLEASNLRQGDMLAKFNMPVIEHGETYSTPAYSQGFYSGDGTAGYEYSFLYEPKFNCQTRLVGKFTDDYELVSGMRRKIWRHGPMLDKKFVPINGNLSYKLSWLAGLIDSDGTQTNDKNGSGFQITSISEDFLLNVKLLLTTLGCQTKVVLGNLAGMKWMPDGRGSHKQYQCQTTYRLLIGNTDSNNLYKLGLRLNRINFENREPQRDARQYVKVVSVSKDEPCEHFCFTEPKEGLGTFNGIVTGQSEIILRPYQFCNLSEVVVRAEDTLEILKEKVKLATILGTYQATLTDFKYLRAIWKKNTEEERLLGVSLTGIMDNINLVNNIDWLNELKEVAIQTNKKLANKLGIQQSASITCVKPSGTVSQLVDAASGIHPRWSRYYIRTVRCDNKDPITQLLKNQGIPNEPDVMSPNHVTVFSFPQKAPDKAVTREDIKAIDHLNIWKQFQDNWCEHKPSITVNIKENEWLEVQDWVWKNFNQVSGIAFLPYDDHNYKQAPYQEITKEQYREIMETFPKEIDWSKLPNYEKEDETQGSQDLACSAGVCEIVDVVRN